MRENYINFTLPNMIEYFFINSFFILLYKKSPNYFNENYRISEVTATIDYSPWNTHRVHKYISAFTFKNIYDFYHKNNILIHFLFENTLIEEKDTLDTYSNLLLEHANKKGNLVTAKSLILENYIKQKYKNYEFIKQIESETNKFEIDSKFNNRIHINNLKNSKNAYITLNPICPENCRFYDIHRTYIEKEQKEFYKPSKIFVCPLKASISFYDLKNNSNFISNKEINNYIEKGFKNFKISDNYIVKNTHVNYSIFDVIESYIYYLIKTKFQNIVRKKVTMYYLKHLNKRSEYAIE